VISNELGSLPNLIPVDLPSLRDAESAKVTELVHGYFTVSGDELRLTAQVRDATPSKNNKLISASGKLSAGLLPLADALARQIAPNAHPYVTKNENALRELFQGVAAPSPDQFLAHVELAVKADPSYGPAHLTRIQLLLTRGDTNGAKAALAEATPYIKGFSETDRARLGMIQAGLGGSRSERVEAPSLLSVGF